MSTVTTKVIHDVGKPIECLKDLEAGLIKEEEVGVYVGETSRTLAERALEHVTCSERIDVENFITKHWALKHSNLTEYPKMRFKVIKQCKDALSRQVTEAVWIEDTSNLNSKAEWARNSLAHV